MRLARFEYKGGIHYGLVEGDQVRFIQGSIFGDFQETGRTAGLAEVRLLAPTQPSKVVCVGQNYAGHIKELGLEPPQEPVIFLKPSTCIIGPEEDIIYPKVATRVDYEGELGLVIKKEMKDVSPEEAKEYILGCTCFNDITERDLVNAHPINLALSKGFDTFGAYGPYIATDPDPDALGIKTLLNGQTVQEDNTANCIFKAGFVLGYISQRMTLLPGDVVITGTPKGIGPMKPGDRIEVEIEGLGRLGNTVRG